MSTPPICTTAKEWMIGVVIGGIVTGSWRFADDWMNELVTSRFSHFTGAVPDET